MSSLIDKGSVAAYGAIEETADAYTMADVVIWKSIVPDGFLIDSEPPHASEHGWMYIDGAFVEREPVPELIDYEAQERNRKTRNAKLSECDWTQLPDVNLTADCKAAFATYRQALRDADMLNPVWPEAPAEEWVA